MPERLISAHNPMTGPRHLGHFVSTLKEWKTLQNEYECYIVIDDLIAHFIYPREREKILNRAFFTIKDILASGLDVQKSHILLTSMVPESLELMMLLNAFVDLEYCMKLYSQSFCGLLKHYHRNQLGLSRHTSLTEFVYPQTALPALTLGLQALAFQGGEEIRGYVYIMEEMVREFNRINGEVLTAPHLVSPQVPYLAGTDGQHMITGNHINLAAPAEDIRARVAEISDYNVIVDWCRALDQPQMAEAWLARKEISDDARVQMTEFLVGYLEPFRTFRVTNEEILGIVSEGATFAKPLVKETINKVKASLSIPVFS